MYCGFVRDANITILQNMEKAFKAMGYATQVKSLSDFYDDYGLEGDDDDGKTDQDGEDEDEEGDSDEEADDDESGSDEEMEG